MGKRTSQTRYEDEANRHLLATGEVGTGYSIHADTTTRTPPAKSTAYILYISVMFVIAGITQVVTLPMFIFTVTESSGAGPYFVLLFCAILFSFFFGFIAWIIFLTGGVSQETIHYTMSRRHVFLALVGIFNGVNGIMVVYAAPQQRNPPVLQPIFLNAAVPFTLVGSRLLLNKKYAWSQILAGCFVIGGILLAMGPEFHNLATHKESTQFLSGTWWAAVMVLSCAPLALMNITEELIFQKAPTYNVWVMLAVQSLWQLLAVACLCWVDWQPSFGTSIDIDAWKASWCGMLFAMAYIGTYYYGALIMRDLSANYNGMLSSAVNPLSAIFWIVAGIAINMVPVARWIGTPIPSDSSLAYIIPACMVIFVASWQFKSIEAKRKEKEHMQSLLYPPIST